MELPVWVNSFAARVFALLGWFPVGLYGAKGDGVTDDTAAFQAAINAVVAAGGGTVVAGAKSYAYSALLLFPTNVAFLGADMQTCRLVALAAGANVRFYGRRGTSGNFTVDGMGIATNGVDFTATECEFRAITIQNHVGDQARVGTNDTVLNGTCQNVKFFSVRSINAGGSDWVIDGGSNNNEFYGCYGSGTREYLIKIQRSAAPPPFGGTQPTNNRWFGGIFERPLISVAVGAIGVGNGLGNIRQTAGADNMFFGTQFPAGVAGSNCVHVSLSDAGANASRLHFDGPCAWDGSNGVTPSTALKASAGGVIYIKGSPSIRLFGTYYDVDDTSQIIGVENVREINAAITARFNQAGAQKVHRRCPGLIPAMDRGDWVLNSIAATCSRAARVDSLAPLASGTLYLIRTLDKVPAGVPIDSLTFAQRANVLAGQTNQWAVICDAALNVLGKSNDDAANAWGADQPKTFTFATPVVPAATDWLYFGIVIVATTMPQLVSVSSAQAAMIATPRYAGPSTAGLTNPASLGAAAAAIGLGGNVPWAYAL